MQYVLKVIDRFLEIAILSKTAIRTKCHQTKNKFKCFYYYAVFIHYFYICLF